MITTLIVPSGAETTVIVAVAGEASESMIGVPDSLALGMNELQCRFVPVYSAPCQRNQLTRSYPSGNGKIECRIPPVVRTGFDQCPSLTG